MDYTTKLSNNTNPSFDMTKVFDTEIISKEFDDITNGYYKQGYEDAVSKACEWIKLYILNHDYIDIFELEENFKKALENG